MDAEESRKRRSETEVEVLSQGSPTRSRLEPDASPSTRTLYPRIHQVLLGMLLELKWWKE